MAEGLRRKLLGVAGDQLRHLGFFVLAADGSRFELPRTAAHEDAFDTLGKPNDGPQLWVTMLWQMSMNLPWDWRVGGGRSSERDHLRQMLNDTPDDTLLVMDAGFTGYGLLSAIVDSGRHFLLRASKRVELLTDLGHVEQVDGQTVHLWPAYAQRDLQPPLTLRLIRLRSTTGKRRRGVYLLTSVRDATRLSDQQAGKLYRQRWGVELGYRALKQTLEARKLRSHSPRQALFEIHGLILGLTLLGMMTFAAIHDVGGDAKHWSVAGALRRVRRGVRHSRRLFAWPKRLREAVKDGYVRQRKARRSWPRKKQADPPPGRPKIRKARRDETTLAQQLEAATK